MYQVQFFATTFADWAQAIELIDATTNHPLEIEEGAAFELDVRDGRDCQIITRTTADGTIETPGNGVVQWRFTGTELRGLCATTTYRVGLVMTGPAVPFKFLSALWPFSVGKLHERF